MIHIRILRYDINFSYASRNAWLVLRDKSMNALSANREDCPSLAGDRRKRAFLGRVPMIKFASLPRCGCVGRD